jgi:hypothetical protein
MQAISPSERPSSHVPPIATDEVPEASSEEEPSKQDSSTDSPGEGKPVTEESAPAPVHVTRRATEQWSSLAGSGSWGPVSGLVKIFENGLPWSEDLWSLMVL